MMQIYDNFHEDMGTQINLLLVLCKDTNKKI